ncbi:MAG TPA: PAS domain-containing sensor histidine kinase [Chloroflexia bacterium]|nr:PAS domain-containing sensor histidine kinase [Chloroflexia bacterium]
MEEELSSISHPESGPEVSGFDNLNSNDDGTRILAEAALWESEQNFRFVVESIKDYGIFLLDPTGRIVTWNAGAEKIEGYKVSEIIGKHFSIFYPPEDLAWNKPAYELEEATKHGRFEDEGWRLRKDGSRFWANVVITALLDKQGKLRGFVKVTRDLTERKRREENALRQSQEQLQIIMDNTIASIYIKDAQGRYLLVNRQIEKVFNINREEWLGKTDTEIFGKEIGTVNFENDRQVLKSGKAARLEEQIPHKDGLHTYISLKFPLFDANDEAYAVCGISTDITEQKRSEEGSKFLAEASSVLASSLDYEVTLRNTAQLTVPTLADWCMLYIVEENGSLRRLEVVHSDPEIQKSTLALLEAHPFDLWPDLPVARAASTGQPQLVPQITDEVLQRVSTSKQMLDILRSFKFQSTLSVPMLTRGKVVGVINLVRTDNGRSYDEIDLHLLEELARRAAFAIDNAMLYKRAQKVIEDQQELDRLKDTFLSIASHELRTPITTIRGYAQILERNILREENSDPQWQAFLEKNMRAVQNITRQTHRVNELVGRLLDFSRIQEGRLELNYSPHTNLPLLLERIVEQQQAVTEDHALALELPSEKFPVRYDEARLEQVLNNLLSNATKYSPTGTTITLGMYYNYKQERPVEAVVFVRDQGRGISLEHQQHLFERFYRVRSRAHSSVDGLGLGLYISHEIVTQHGGRMWVESQPGVGSTFYFSLPL